MPDNFEIYEYGEGAIRVKIPDPFNRVSESADQAVIDSFLKNAPDIVEEVRAAAPKRTGNLAQSFQVTDLLPYGKNKWAVRFYFDAEIAPYWRWVLYGRNPDPGSRIYPLTKQALAFDWEVMGPNPNTADGRWIFSNVAMVPIKPNRFLQNALRDAASRFTNRVPEDFIVFLFR